MSELDARTDRWAEKIRAVCLQSQVQILDVLIEEFEKRDPQDLFTAKGVGDALRETRTAVLRQGLVRQ